MSVNILYTAEATARGGREGHVRSADGSLDLALVVPKALGGPGGSGANPEQLFAAGYAACFEGAARLVAKDAKVALGPRTYVTARVGIGPREESGFGLAVTIEAHLDGVERAQAETIVKTAHENICPYSHATRGNVEVAIKVV